jgi:hypothetical protein
MGLHGIYIGRTTSGGSESLATTTSVRGSVSLMPALTGTNTKLCASTVGVGVGVGVDVNVTLTVLVGLSDTVGDADLLVVAGPEFVPLEDSVLV